MIGLDTNVLVRYLVQDDKTQAAVATAFIESKLSAAQPGFISLIVLCETVWVLTDCYHLSNGQISRILESLLSTRELTIQESDVAWAALKIFRNETADFADVLIGKIGKEHSCSTTVTFDKAAAKLEEFDLLK